MIYANLGRREQGKTTLALYLARRYPARVYFDPRGLLPADARIEGVSGIARAFTELHVTGRGTIVITPDQALDDAFHYTSKEVKSWVRSRLDPIAYVIDEARMVDLALPSFDWILRCSSRQRIAVILTAHRPTDLSVNIRAILDVWCIFQTVQEHDLQAIRDRCGPAVAGQVRRLRPYEFIVWDDARATMRVVSDPSSWFIPLVSASPSTPAMDELTDELRNLGTSRSKNLLDI